MTCRSSISRFDAIAGARDRHEHVTSSIEVLYIWGPERANLDSAVALQKMCKAEVGEAQCQRSLMRVKHVDDEDAKIALQPRNIALASMEYLDHLSITRMQSSVLFIQVHVHAVTFAWA